MDPCRARRRRVLSMGAGHRQMGLDGDPTSRSPCHADAGALVRQAKDSPTVSRVSTGSLSVCHPPVTLMFGPSSPRTGAATVSSGSRDAPRRRRVRRSEPNRSTGRRVGGRIAQHQRHGAAPVRRRGQLDGVDLIDGPDVDIVGDICDLGVEGSPISSCASGPQARPRWGDVVAACAAALRPGRTLLITAAPTDAQRL